MNTFCQVKKLSLDDGKKAVLVTALEEAADLMDKYTRRIYDETAKAIRGCGDRIMLVSSEIDIVKFALQHYESAHDLDANVEELLLQLIMTRKDYYAYIQAREAANN